MRKTMLFMVVAMLLISIVSAQEVIVTKETSENIRINDIIEVKINILNPYSMEKNFEVSERLPHNIQLIDPSQPDEVKKYNGIDANFLKWNLIISPTMISTISYKIKITSLGDYSIQATDVRDISNDDIYFSNDLEFSVVCDPDNKCESDENYLNCPEDCAGSIADGICSYAADGVCDPDCIEEPDCKVSKINLLNLSVACLISAIIIFLIYLLIKKKGQKQVQDIQQ